MIVNVGKPSTLVTLAVQSKWSTKNAGTPAKPKGKLQPAIVRSPVPGPQSLLKWDVQLSSSIDLYPALSALSLTMNFINPSLT